MQHFTTLGNAAYKFFKTFRANLSWHEIVPRVLSIFAKYSTPPVTADTLCPRGISTECFEKLVSSISKGGKMLHFVYFVYIFF